jgi:hypothetical protein
MMADGEWNARSATPLSDATGAVEKLRRRFAPVFAALRLGKLPEQSIIFAVLVLLLSTLIFQPSTALAQQYSIDWFKIAGGGGGTSTGGTYQVSGTIGQHDAGGPMTGGNYSLTGGFWALISVVQTAGAPTLFINHAGNTVTVYWQDVPDWALQQNGNLASTAGWSTSSGVTPVNGTNYLNLTSPTGNLFFRLAK